jgi:membrane associated rhomboid family serine protease
MATTPITFILIGITVAISFLTFNRPALKAALMMNPYHIRKQGQYYRFITSGFIHQHHMHLLINMFSFYFFGTAIEQIFGYLFGAAGAIYYIALYLMAIVVSDLPTFFKQQDNPRYNSLGASGGVAAVIFAFIIFEPLQSICLYFVFCLPGFILGVGYIIYSYYQGRRSNDNINHEAHLYGALFGLVFCIAVYPSSINLFYQQVTQQITEWISSL